MNALPYLGIALSVLVLGVCVLLYIRQSALQGQIKTHREQLDRIEIGIHSFTDLHDSLVQRIDQLASDVLQRDIYQNADDRHQHAIKDAKAGCDVSMLVLRHGLSSDEASLIHALHGKHKAELDPPVETENSSLHSWPGEI